MRYSRSTRRIPVTGEASVRLLLTEDSENHTGRIDDCNRDARVTAERLPDRCARDVCLLCCVRNDCLNFRRG